MIGCTIQCNADGLWCYSPSTLHINLILPVETTQCINTSKCSCGGAMNTNDILSSYCTCPTPVEDVAMCKCNTIDYDSTVKYYGSQIFQQPLQNDIKNIDNYNHNSFNFEASSFQKNIEEEKPLDQTESIDNFERIQFLLSQLSPQRNKSKEVNHNNMYYLRKDVITKSILRAMRKYYFNEFRLDLDFTKVNSLTDASDSSTKGYAKAREYLIRKFKHRYSSEMVYLLLSLLDPKGKYFILPEEAQETRSLVCKLLYKYNRPTLEEMISMPHFIEFFARFIKIPSLVGKEIKIRNDEECKKAYQKQVDLFKMICECNSIKLSKILLTFL